MKGLVSLSIVLVAAVTIGSLVGCGSKPADKPQAAPTPPGSAATMEDSSEENITQSLALMSAEDRELAIKQRVCPVTGERLGTMGAPPKIDVKGHAVFICCEGCKEALLEKPDEFLTKLGLVSVDATDKK